MRTLGRPLPARNTPLPIARTQRDLGAAENSPLASCEGSPRAPAIFATCPHHPPCRPPRCYRPSVCPDPQISRLMVVPSILLCLATLIRKKGSSPLALLNR